METKTCSFDFEIDINRMDEFTAVHFTVPKELRRWLTFHESKPVEFLLPNTYFDNKVKREKNNWKWLTSRSKQMLEKYHYVFTKEYLEAYKKGDTMLFMTHMEEIEKEQFLSSPDAQDRIYSYGDDGWLRRGDEILMRDIMIEAWPTYYGNPKKMKAKMEEHPNCVSVEIKPNTCYQNHEISGRSLVYVKIRLSKEQLDKYFEQDYLMRQFWVLEDILGLERIEQESY